MILMNFQEYNKHNFLSITLFLLTNSEPMMVKTEIRFMQQDTEKNHDLTVS